MSDDPVWSLRSQWGTYNQQTNSSSHLNKIAKKPIKLQDANCQ